MPDPSTSPAVPSRGRTGHIRIGLELMLYLGVALVAVLPALPAGRVVGDGVDLYGTFWFYWWIGECLEQGWDPSFTDLMFHPLGKDIFAHTGNNFVDALLATPFQALIGYPDYQPWWIAVVLLGNALCFRPLARDLLHSRAAVVTATVLWQLCPYVLFELIAGRTTQAFLWFLPLAVRHFLHIGGVAEGAALPGVAPHAARWRDPVLAGLYTGLSAWTYWFMGYFMALLFAWLAAVDLVRRPDRKGRLAGYGLAALSAALVVGPGVLAMAGRATAGDVPGVDVTAGRGISEPVALANNVAQHLHGYWLMETQGQPMFGYLLFGLGLALAALVARDRARWVGALVVALLFALGPTLPVAGGLPMPHYLMAYHYLPFFDRLWFPVRLVVISMMAGAILLGMGVDRLEVLRRRRLPRVPAWVLPVAVVALHLAEQHRVLAFPLLSRDMTPPAVYRVIGQTGGGLIELPIGMSKPSIAYQPVHGQPTFGGMAENAPIFHPDGFRRRLSNNFIIMLRRVSRDPDRELSFTPAALDALRAEGYRWVVLDRQLIDSDIGRSSFARRMPESVVDRAPFYVQDAISQQIGPPVMVEERLVVWDLVGGVEVPQALAPTPQGLSERTWPKVEMPAYEEWMRAQGRLKDMGGERPKDERDAGKRPQRPGGAGGKGSGGQGSGGQGSGSQGGPGGPR